jgi:hypothetical protein
MYTKFWDKTVKGEETTLKTYAWMGEDNIKINFKKTVWESVNRIHLAQDTDQGWALVNTTLNLWDS